MFSTSFLCLLLALWWSYFSFLAGIYSTKDTRRRKGEKDLCTGAEQTQTTRTQTALSCQVLAQVSKLLFQAILSWGPFLESPVNLTGPESYF